MSMTSIHSRARGFTLVEALVALLALSIGLLGIAGMQLTGMRANMSAGWRSQATYLGYDIIDRMRANRATSTITSSVRVRRQVALRCPRWISRRGRPTSLRHCLPVMAPSRSTATW